MLSINNQALPAPGVLTLGYTGPAASAMTLLTVQAAWPGLTGEAMAAILAPTAGAFTLGCPDPRTGNLRGFSARLTGCRARALEADAGSIALWSLDANFEEVAP
ncbi:MAG: hypothetical protein GX653_09895 [Clostridiales bacterium]|nr:hypothetical protein [Clostridiales bacterium]